ncbi:MFS transporter [Nocardia rhamnosiphila]|uniref:MFS transporter n=1 Tax=Nocardia rhamnosiphila TaxID=426716 RepID=A0ABV2WRK5_9NOCA
MQHTVRPRGAAAGDAVDAVETATGSGMSRPRPMAGVIVLCAAGIAMSLTQTLIVPLVPLLPALLSTSAANASWAVTVTMAVGAVATPIAGRLGDMVGKRPVLLVCVGAVGAGSVVCAVAPSFPVFMAGRALQGLGVAFVAVGISVMREFVPPAKLGTAVGMTSSSLAVGGAIGLPVAASLAQSYGWRALFWVAACGAGACFAGIRFLIAPSRSRVGGRFDFVGALGLAVVLLTLLLPLSKGLEWGWTNPVTLSLFGISIVASAGWLVYERRRRDPLLDLRVAMLRPVLLGNVIGIVNSFAFYGMELVPIQMLMAPADGAHGFGASMSTAGLLMAPAGVAALVSSNVGARTAGALGPRLTLIIAGSLALIALCAMLIPLVIGWEFPITYLVGISATIGAATGISYATLPTLIMAATPPERTGEANGLNALMRIVGLAAAAAVVGMILANSITEFAGATRAAPSASGYLWATATAATAAVISTIAAALLPRDRPEARVRG